jgi:hypothetical protein
MSENIGNSGGLLVTPREISRAFIFGTLAWGDQRVHGRSVMIRLVGIMFLALTAFFCGSAAAQDSDAKCKIGRPAYCYKHGGTFCAQANTTKTAGACDAWTGACLECHEAITACLGNSVRLRAEPACSRCEAAWQSCMRKIDGRHWPNRQKLG